MGISGFYAGVEELCHWWKYAGYAIDDICGVAFKVVSDFNMHTM